MKNRIWIILIALTLSAFTLNLVAQNEQMIIIPLESDTVTYEDYDCILQLMKIIVEYKDYCHADSFQLNDRYPFIYPPDPEKYYHRKPEFDDFIKWIIEKIYQE